MNQVTILLATYNGGKYLEQQLLSLLAQHYKNWSLLIRDDGSSDDTLEIIQKYISLDKRIALINDNLGSLGCVNNFLILLSHSQTPYTIFCDQDDIWLENKLEVLVNSMHGMDESVPRLAYGGAYLYNLQTGVGPHEIIYPVHDLQAMLFRGSGLRGCSLLFNAALRRKVLSYKGTTSMHDFTVTFLAILFGETIMVNRPLMLYRQHESNVTGHTPDSHKALVRFFFSDYRHKGILIPEVFQTIKQITACFYEQIAPDKRRLLDAFLDFPNKSRVSMFWFVLRHRCTLYGKISPILIKILTRKLWASNPSYP